MESPPGWKLGHTYTATVFHGGSQKPSSENGFENWVWTFECPPDIVIGLRLYLWFITVNYSIISLLTWKLDCLQSISQFYIKVQVCTLSIFHAIFNPITQYKIKLIYKHTLQINGKEIRNYNFCTINVSTKISQELINSIYKLVVKITLKNSCKTDFHYFPQTGNLVD